MRKITTMFCCTLIAGVFATENLATKPFIGNWTFNGVRPENSVSMDGLKPAAKDKIINIDYTFAQPFDASAHEFLNLRLKISSDKSSAARLKINLYNQGGGYLYSRVLPVKQLGEWQNFEFDLHGKSKSAHGARKNFDLAKIKRFRLAVICDQADETVNISIDRAVFGPSEKPDTATVEAQLKKLGDKPVVYAAFTAEAPVIDGKLDEPCWADTVRLTDFHSNKGGAAGEQTEVFLCHDDKNLYIGVKAFAEVLNPVSNLLHEFKESATEHDGTTYNDDCIEIFFSGKPGQYGHIIANLNTTFERIVSPAGSDPAWNPALTMKGAKYTAKDGHYIIEMAVPLAELAQFRDDSGRLTFNIARQNRYHKELSNWCRAFSFHMPEKYAHLIFGKSIGGVAVSGVDQSENRTGISYRCTDETAGKLMTGVQVLYSQDKSELLFTPMLPGNHRFTLANSSGNFLYSTLVFNDREILYRSPVASFGAGQAVASGVIGGNSKVYVNGNPVGQDGKFDLVKGKNIIAAEVSASPELTVRLDENNQFSLDESWKFMAKQSEAWQQFGIDESAWERYEPSKKLPGFVRKTVLVEESRFYPLLNERTPLRASLNAVQPFSFIINGLNGEELQDYRFYLEIPEQVEFVGASAHNSSRYGGPRAQWSEVGKVTNGGGNYTRYEVTFKGNDLKKPGTVQYVPAEKLAIADTITLALTPRIDREFDCYYYYTANHGNYTELKRSFKVRVLPELAKSGPQRMRMLTWFSFRDMDDLELQRKIYLEHANAGFNIANTASWSADIVKPLGMKYCSRFNFEKSGFDATAVLKKYPSIRFIDHKGTFQPYKVPFYHIAHNAEFRRDLAEALKQYLAAAKPDILDWDFEFDTFTGIYTSYDRDTLEFFRKEHNIAAELNVQEIRAGHEAEWSAFMNKLTGEAFRFIREVAGPMGIEVDVYSGYPSEYTRNHYGIDYEYVMPHVDFAMMGYGRPMKEIREALRLSEKFRRPVLFGVCARPYFLHSIGALQPITPAMVLRLVIDCGYGAMYWGHYCSDGELLHSFNEINRMLALYENFILDGERIEAGQIMTLAGIEKDDIAVYRLNGQFLVLMLNQDGSPKDVKLEIKEKKIADIREFYSGQQFNANQEISYKLKDNAVAAFVLK